MTYLLGGRKVCGPNRRLAVFGAGIPHPARLARAILIGKIVMEPTTSRFTEDRARFVSWREELCRPYEDRRRIGRSEVEVRLRRPAISLRRMARKTPAVRWEMALMSEGRLSKVGEMACDMARDYGSPLTTEVVARHAGLHPNDNMSLFRRTFGTTILKSIVQHRRSHAQRLLAATDELILNIALDSGFGSLSRFDDAFRKAFGFTSCECRRIHQWAQWRSILSTAGMDRSICRPGRPAGRSGPKLFPFRLLGVIPTDESRFARWIIRAPIRVLGFASSGVLLRLKRARTAWGDRSRFDPHDRGRPSGPDDGTFMPDCLDLRHGVGPEDGPWADVGGRGLRPPRRRKGCFLFAGGRDGKIHRRPGVGISCI